MRRPTRTHRLSITAIVSLLGFAVAAGAGVRSFWVQDGFRFKHWQLIQIDTGCIFYSRWHGRAAARKEGIIEFHVSSSDTQWRLGMTDFWKFQVNDQQIISAQPGLWAVWTVGIPLWPILLLLLIAPVCWLIARSSNAPAFPVVAKEA